MLPALPKAIPAQHLCEHGRIPTQVNWMYAASEAQAVLVEV